MKNTTVTTNNKPYIKDEFKNKCFSKDLVITFGMGSQQKLKKLEQIERYEHFIKNFDYRELNEFEKFQVSVCSTMYLPNKLSFLYTIDLFYLDKANRKHYHFRPHDFYAALEAVKRDRTGILKNEFLKSIINHGPEAVYLECHPYCNNNVKPLYQTYNKSFQINQANKWENSFSKLKRSDGTAVYKMIKSQSDYDKTKLITNKEIYFNNSNGNDQEEGDESDGSYFIDERSKAAFGSKQFETIVENEIGQPMGTMFSDSYAGVEKYGKIQSFPFGCFVIPSFKEICYSVLREMFLISNKAVIDKLLTLPIPILQDFLKSCFNDEKPTGKELSFKLYNQLVKLQQQQQYLNYNLSELFPIDKMISSCFKRDGWFRYNYDLSLPQDLFYPAYSDKFSINVYDNYHLFKLSELPSSLKSNILFKSNISSNNKTTTTTTTTTSTSTSTSTSSTNTNPILNGHSIVCKEKFISNFNKATNRIFANPEGIPKGCVFMGGIITNCLLNNDSEESEGICNGFETSDIDICFFQCGREDIESFLKFYFPEEEADSYTTTQLGNHVTFSKHYPFRHIQINLYSFLSIEDVLLGVDIEASCFAYDGIGNLYCLERSIHSLNYRMNIASEFSYRVRGDRQYQKRLIKYLNRGFNIFYLPGGKKINEIIRKSKLDDGSFIPSMNQIGFSLLLSAKLDKTILYQIVNEKKTNSSLPYGPTVTKSKFESYIKKNCENLYDGYNNGEILDFIYGITDIVQKFTGVREYINYGRLTSWDRQLSASDMEPNHFQIFSVAKDDVEYYFPEDNDYYYTYSDMDSLSDDDDDDNESNNNYNE